MMDFAKIIRNNVTTPSNRINVVRALCHYISQQDPLFNVGKFRQVALGQVEFDNKTEAYTYLKEDVNDQAT